MKMCMWRECAKAKRIGALLVALLLVAGCRGAQPAPVTNAPPPADTGSTGGTSSAPEGLHPPEARTHMPEIDRVIEAAVKREASTLADLAHMTPMSCALQTAGRSAKPPCPADKTDGSSIEAFPFGTCEPYYVVAGQDLRQFITERLSRTLYVYAVYRSNLKIGASEKTAAYAVLLAARKDDPESRTLFLDRSGAIVALYLGCGMPTSSIPSDASFILAPLGP